MNIRIPVYVLMIHYVEYNNVAHGLLVDLSHAFDNTTYFWSLKKPLSLTITRTYTPGKNYTLQNEEIHAGTTHSGTHMDAPCQVVDQLWCIGDIPLDRFFVPAVVVDISDHVGEDPDVHLTTEHLLEWEALHEEIPQHCLLLIRTGWSKFYADPIKYIGTKPPVSDMSPLKYPSIHPEAARWLMTHRKVVGVGLDSMSLDQPAWIPGTHVALAENNVYGLENLCNLEELPATGARAYVLPLKLANAGGSPCRVVAEVEDTD